MKAALHDGSKFEKQLLVHLLCVFQMDLIFSLVLNFDEQHLRQGKFRRIYIIMKV